MAEGLEHRVALCMPIGLVDGGEVVQVQHQQRQRLLLFAAVLQAVGELALEVIGTGQGRELVEQAMFAKQPLAFFHLRADCQLFAVPMVDADGQQDHAYRHRPGFEPVVPGDAVGQADELVKAVDPPREKDARQPQRQVIGDAPGGAAFEHQAQPHQGEQGGTAFADDVQPHPLADAFELAAGQVKDQPGVGGNEQQGEFPTMRFEHGKHGRGSLGE
ncbi:hypothetical protein PS687_06002 [Pseudomonas fluorescens]|nr:hypothetical protein PS687_06002 [Pseudomonas fluorescens]